MTSFWGRPAERPLHTGRAPSGNESFQNVAGGAAYSRAGHVGYASVLRIDWHP